MTVLPARYVHLAEARRRHGGDVDRLGRWLLVGDPLADDVADALAPLPTKARRALLDRVLLGRAAAGEVPRALATLLDEARTFPQWVDAARLERGGAAFVRTGAPGGLVLGCSSLVQGYCSPAGNKPLVFSGRLESGARRRLAETARFVQAVTSPGGMRPYAPGWQAAVRVRLMHAGVRRMLLASPLWRAAAWGAPINAFDSAGTILLFSLVLADGVDALGITMRPDERADLLHLWRWVGHVMGVPGELLFPDEPSARRFWDLVTTTQEAPDDDARRLAHTLLDDALAPPGEGPVARARAHAVRGLGWAVSRRLLSPALTAALHYPPPDAWDAVVTRWYAVNRAVTGLRSSRLERRRYQLGVRYWEDAVRLGLGGTPAEFSMPTRLRAVEGARARGRLASRRRSARPTTS